ncbi:MAG: glycosyltransferase family 2 protein [Pseudomonadota bacterium]
MDETKAPMAAMTMVGGDHFFLQRWVDYYGRQLGREHLYVLSHGGDPEHKRIAAGCNIIYLPHDATRYCFNQRRWQMLSMFTSGFTRYYNWVLTGDVDELVAPDPAVADSLLTYMRRFEPDNRPRVLSPVALEMVHNPDLEPVPISPDRSILAVRRIFRLNANYNKPCITRNKIVFAPGGHFANQPQKFLAPDLYLFHLRFIDYRMTEERLSLRRAQREQQSGALEDTERKVTGWDNAWETYKHLSTLEPVAETVDFPEVREKLNAGWRRKDDKSPFFTFGGGRSKEVYKLPERFASVF